MAALGRAVDSLPVLGDYALKYQAQLLADSDRRQEAIPLLQKLLKQYPDSPLARQTLLQLGDLQFASGSFADAFTTNDAIQAFVKFNRLTAKKPLRSSQTNQSRIRLRFSGVGG